MKKTKADDVTIIVFVFRLL